MNVCLNSGLKKKRIQKGRQRLDLYGMHMFHFEDFVIYLWAMITQLHSTELQGSAEGNALKENQMNNILGC